MVQTYVDLVLNLLYLYGPDAAGKQQVAAALAAGLDALVLRVDLAGALKLPLPLAQVLKLAFRYAWFYAAVPYLDRFDELCCGGNNLAYRRA